MALAKMTTLGAGMASYPESHVGRELRRSVYSGRQNCRRNSGDALPDPLYPVLHDARKTCGQVYRTRNGAGRVHC